MLFNSYIYTLVFLPVAALGYFAINKIRLGSLARAWLLIASLLHYSYWNPKYLPLIMISMIANYAIGTNLVKGYGGGGFFRDMLLYVGIGLNLSALAYYKYADFFLSNLNSIFGWGLPLLHVALPLAISFFTFQQIAYLVDSYRGETREYDFLNYCLFVTFWPQLIAGPIVHHKEMMPQFARVRGRLLSHENLARGIYVFSIGLFKKVVIADTFSVWATQGFDRMASLNLWEAWAFSLSYTFQLYFDFSGYSDMAMGSAYLFNIKLPYNFNSPYKAANIQDFWRRWHITLSRWLRDYIYVPLGGNRGGQSRTYFNLFLTFFLGGIWHGAGWTFVLWGAMHGVATAAHKAWLSLGGKMNKYAAWALTFLFVHFAWVFFRAKNFLEATKIFRGLFGLNGASVPEKLRVWLGELPPGGFFTYGTCASGTFKSMSWCLAAFAVVLLLRNSNEEGEEFSPGYLRLGAALGMFLVSLFSMNKVSEFLYFNF